jgi:hypothetical protein
MPPAEIARRAAGIGGVQQVDVVTGPVGVGGQIT